MKKVVEICAGSYQDCLAAQKMGASRVELNSALSVGGLTPSVAVLRRVKKETQIHVICMVRPRGGGFCYDEQDAVSYTHLIFRNKANIHGYLIFLNSIIFYSSTAKKRQVFLMSSYRKMKIYIRITLFMFIY